MKVHKNHICPRCGLPIHNSGIHVECRIGKDRSNEKKKKKYRGYKLMGFPDMIARMSKAHKDTRKRLDAGVTVWTKGDGKRKRDRLFPDLKERA